MPSTPRRTCRSTSRPSGRTSSPARSTSSSGRTSACCTGGREALDALPTYKLRPADDRFETGTLNHEGIAGSLAAVEYIAEVGERYGASYTGAFAGMTGRRLHTHAGMAAIRAYEMALFARLLDGLETIPGARVWGITDRSRFDERTPTAAVTFDGITPEAVSVALGARGIATWWGNFYAVGVTERLGLEPDGVLRIGLTHYNTAARGRPARRRAAHDHRRLTRRCPRRTSRSSAAASSGRRSRPSSPVAARP